ncbi:SRPBCC family protein [Rhizobiaceae sp. 2RAB30]
MTELAKPPVSHATIVIERNYQASPARLFVAFADPAQRIRWGVPSSNAELVYDEADFRIGGVDVSRCGPRGNLIYRVEARYHDIMPGQRIVYSEIVRQEEFPLSFALITVDVEAAPGGSRLILTDQVTAYGGARMIDGHRAGHESALDNLRAELESEVVA